MQTQAVYDFLNSHANDGLLATQLRALNDLPEEGYISGISALAAERGCVLPIELVSEWLRAAFAQYDEWATQQPELTEEELALVAGGSGSTTGTTVCAAGYPCRSCCPGSKCTTCYCPITGAC